MSEVWREILYAEFISELSLTYLHSTTMLESLQVSQTVDKQETDKIFELASEFFRFFFRFVKI